MCFAISAVHDWQNGWKLLSSILLCFLGRLFAYTKGVQAEGDASSNCLKYSHQNCTFSVTKS